MPANLTNVKLSELSLVKRGANRGARVVLIKHDLEKPDFAKAGELDGNYPNSVTKHDFSADERQSAANSGAALPDGSFPIKSAEDVKNAVRLVGKATDPTKAKAHIIARAKSIGAAGELPDDWSKSWEDEVGAVVDKVAGDTAGLDAADLIKLDVAKRDARGAIIDIITEKSHSEADKAALVQKSIDKFKDHIARVIGDEFSKRTQESTMTEAEIAALKKSVDDATALAKDANAKLAKMELIAKMSDSHKSHMEGLDSQDAKDKFASMSADERDASMKKSADVNKADPVVKSLMAQNTELAKSNEALAKSVGELQGDKTKAVFAKRATDIGQADTFGETLQKAYGTGGDADAQGKIEQLIKALAAQANPKLFSEVGSTNVGKSGATAYDQLKAKAKDLKKIAGNEKLSEHQLFAKAYADPENKELVEQHKAEEGGRRAA